LIEGRGGILDVAIDGQLAYSKKTTRRFPAAADIITMIRARRSDTTS
jgi:predicted Rdx family selenoprotein